MIDHQLNRQNDDVVFFENFFDNDAVDWCVWYFNQFSEHRFNGIKYIQDTHWNLPFNKWFRDYLIGKIETFLPEAKLHSAYIGNDVFPGGIHTDGWIYEGEKELSYKTILVPLHFNVPSYTVIFNQMEAQGLTLNAVTGLDSLGIDNAEYSTVIDSTLPFSETYHKKWLSHLDISGLAGLTVHSILEWIPGRAMSWNRSRWHGPATFPTGKVERYHLTIMTHR